MSRTRRNTAKNVLLKAFDDSQTKQISDVCRQSGVHPTTFYFHYKSDTNFRKLVLIKQRDWMNQEIEKLEKTEQIAIG